jgi:hypothetical protein
MLQLRWWRRKLPTPLLLQLLPLPCLRQLQLACHLPLLLLLLLPSCCCTSCAHEAFWHHQLQFGLRGLLGLASSTVLVVLCRAPCTVSTRRVALNLAAHVLRWRLRLRQDLPF